VHGTFVRVVVASRTLGSRGESMRRTAVVIDAVNATLRHLALAPDSVQVQELRAEGVGYIREATAWSDSPPTVEARDALMAKVLRLHAAARRLGQPRR
jgi:hypothetical protein